MSVPLESGTLVVLIKERVADPSDGGPWPVGTQFTIRTSVSAEGSPDGKPYYWGDINEGANNIWAPADSIAAVVEGRSVVIQNDSPAGDSEGKRTLPDGPFSHDAIAAHLVFLDRSHKMVSSDHLVKQTHYSKSAGMIRQLLVSSEPTQQPAAHIVGNNSDDKENS